MFDGISKYYRLLRKYNRLSNEYDVLNEYAKNHCFDKLLDKLGESLENKRLREENRKLRLKVKELKKAVINKVDSK